MFLYAAATHPSGPSDVPLMQIRDRFVYAYNAQRKAAEARPNFEICCGQLYATAWHPSGHSARPWFRICHDEIFQAVGHPQTKTGSAWFTTRSSPIEAATTTAARMIFTDWPGGGYAAAASAVRNLYRGEPVTTRHVARTLCTGDSTVQHDLERAMRMGLVKKGGRRGVGTGVAVVADHLPLYLLTISVTAGMNCIIE